jgi:formate dehydrogenase accessory protein FdhD
MAYIYRYENGPFAQFERPVVREQPLTILVHGVEVATFLCMPDKLDYLTVGFLAFEGLIHSPDDMCAPDVDAEHGVVDVMTVRPQALRHWTAKRRYHLPINLIANRRGRRR